MPFESPSVQKFFSQLLKFHVKHSRVKDGINIVIQFLNQYHSCSCYLLCLCSTRYFKKNKCKKTEMRLFYSQPCQKNFITIKFNIQNGFLCGNLHLRRIYFFFTLELSVIWKKKKSFFVCFKMKIDWVEGGLYMYWSHKQDIIMLRIYFFIAGSCLN